MTSRALAVRTAPLPFLLLATALVPQHGPGTILLATPGVALTLAAPASVGALPALATDVLLWLAAYGTHATPPATRTTAFAATLYLAHAAVALAATIPTGAVVHDDIVTAWARRCLPGLAMTIGAACITAQLGHPRGSAVLDLAGLAAALLCAAAIAWTYRHRRGSKPPPVTSPATDAHS